MKARVLVGRNLRRLRVAQGISQESLGLSAGCEPSYVGRIERGQENVGVDLLELLAATLGTPISELFAPVEPGGVTPNLRPGRKRQPAAPEAQPRATGKKRRKAGAAAED